MEINIAENQKQQKCIHFKLPGIDEDDMCEINKICIDVRCPQYLTVYGDDCQSNGTHATINGHQFMKIKRFRNTLKEKIENRNAVYQQYQSEHYKLQQFNKEITNLISQLSQTKFLIQEELEKKNTIKQQESLWIYDAEQIYKNFEIPQNNEQLEKTNELAQQFKKFDYNRPELIKKPKYYIQQIPKYEQIIGQFEESISNFNQTINNHKSLLDEKYKLSGVKIKNGYTVVHPNQIKTVAATLLQSSLNIRRQYKFGIRLIQQGIGEVQGLGLVERDQIIKDDFKLINWKQNAHILCFTTDFNFKNKGKLNHKTQSSVKEFEKKQKLLENESITCDINLDTKEMVFSTSQNQKSYDPISIEIDESKTYCPVLITSNGSIIELIDYDIIKKVKQENI